MHVSTTYCNVDREVIHEQLYPPHADWRDTIRVVEQVDEEALKVLTPKLINSGPRALPNTYTFAKSLAEHVVADHAHLLPCVIFRPSIGKIECLALNVSGARSIVIGHVVVGPSLRQSSRRTRSP